MCHWWWKRPAPFVFSDPLYTGPGRACTRVEVDQCGLRFQEYDTSGNCGVGVYVSMSMKNMKKLNRWCFREGWPGAANSCRWAGREGLHWRRDIPRGSRWGPLWNQAEKYSDYFLSSQNESLKAVARRVMITTLSPRYPRMGSEQNILYHHFECLIN